MKFWRENDGLISVNIQIRRPRFICFKEFHENISEYLLKDNRFEQYELDIKIKGGAYIGMTILNSYLIRILFKLAIYESKFVTFNLINILSIMI